MSPFFNENFIVDLFVLKESDFDTCTYTDTKKIDNCVFHDS